MDLKYGNSLKIRELDLIKLGFSKRVASPEESGDAHGYYYYELNLSDENEDFCLISQESKDIQHDCWKVKIFKVDDYVIEDRVKLKNFINFIFVFKNV
jgi:hypothetical protein